MKPPVPQLPRAWYYLGPSRRFSKKPQALEIHTRKLVVFRTEGGKLNAFQRHCIHMGADLSLGAVEGEHLVCHFHNWKYGTDGKCKAIPLAEGKPIPKFAQLASFPVVERHGHAFFFNGQAAEYELPFFFDENPDHYVSSSMKPVVQKTDWYVVPANAFDAPHFVYIHKRIPTEDPKYTSPNAHCRRIEWNYMVEGQSTVDKWVARVMGRKASLDFTVWSGNLIFARTRIGRIENLMMIPIQQTGDSGCVAQIFCYLKKPRGILSSLITKVRLAVQSRISQAFFQQEGDTSEGVAINLSTLGPNDERLRVYLQWLIEYHSGNRKSPEAALSYSAQRGDLPSDFVETAPANQISAPPLA